MNWVLLGGSLAAVLGLAAAAWLLGLGGTKLESDAQAARIAEDMLSGFVARGAQVDARGETALVRGEDGGIAMVRRHGARFVTRRLQPPFGVERRGSTVTVQSGEGWLGPFTMTLASEDEARELTRVLRAPVDAQSS